MTSATAETKLIGDVDGVQTGDAGEVIWSAFLSGDFAEPSVNNLVALSGRDFLTFRNISFVGGGGTIILGTTASSTDIKIQNCSFIQGGATGTGTLIAITLASQVAGNWTIDGCVFIFNSSNAISIVLTTGSSGADYDANIQITNCLFIGGGSANVIFVNNSGTLTFEGGGVDVTNCTKIGGSAPLLLTNGTRLSLTIPCTVQNCVIYAGGSTALNAGESGAIVEDYNLIWASTPRTNVAVGAHSVGGSSAAYAPTFEYGQGRIVGRGLALFGSPAQSNTLGGFHGTSPTSSDISELVRPCGSVAFGTSGTATAGGAKTLTDSGADWGASKFIGWTVKITGGTGSGQVKTISSHTATVLTVDGNWNTQPSTDSTYIIYRGAMASSGTATAGAATTMTDGNAAWGTNMWTGYTLAITGGTGSGQSKVVASNTGTVLTVASSWTTNPDSTSQYKLYRGTDESTVNNAVGCYERGNTWGKETGTVRTGSNAISQLGPGVQDFDIPVSAASTTVSVYVRWDSNYAGTKPQLKVLNGTECGVSDATDTATGSANTWEELSLNFTPTSAGVVTVRIQSNCTTPTGWAFADDFAIS